MSYGLGMQTLLCVVENNDKEWHKDLCLHGMGIQCVKVGPRWSLEIVNKHFLLFPKFTWFLQGDLFSFYILQRYNACWVLTCFQAFVEFKLWFNVR
jgi:hypothetical protein